MCCVFVNTYLASTSNLQVFSLRVLKQIIFLTQEMKQNFVLPKDGTRVQKHIGNSPLIFMYY